MERSSSMIKLRHITFFAVVLLVGCSRSQAIDSITTSELPPTLLNASFVGENDGWVVSELGKLFYTNSGGTRWEHLPIDIGGVLKQISFIDAKQGMATNDIGEVWLSKDSGNTWKKKALVRDDIKFMNIQLVDRFHAWMLSNTLVAKTEDGGENWKILDPILSNSRNAEGLLTKSYFLTPAYGIVGSSGGIAHVTHNGGQSWVTQKITSKEATIDYAFLADEYTGWVGGFPGGLYRTDDGCLTWHLQTLPTTIIEPVILSVYFIDKYEGWVVGFENDSTKDKSGAFILHTSDGGSNWQSIPPPAESYFHHIYFSKRTHGWALAKNAVYRTTDSGQTWQKSLDIQ